MYYSAIGLLAILILFIVNWDILHNPSASYKKTAWKLYRRFLLAVLVYYVSDVLWGVLESSRLSALLFADTTVYFMAMAAGVLFWAEFTVAYLGEDQPGGRTLVLAGRTLAGGIALLSLVNIFVPVLFTVDKACVYRALPARYASLACQILLLLLIAAYSFLSMLRLGSAPGKRRKYGILISFGLIMAVFLFAQLWFPQLPLYSIAYMLGTSLLHSFVANDVKEEFREERKETEKIRELKETISSLLDNMPALTFTKDAKTGVYLACNQAFAEYAHKDAPDGVVGLTDVQIFDAETAAHFMADDKTALSISRPYVFYEDVPDAVGSQRQFQTTKLKYTDASGRLCLLGMCQDVTEMTRIQHENAMTKEAYESLAHSGLIYSRIAQSLARDYTNLFYVNSDSEEYIEFRRDNQGGAFSEARRGLHFFSDCREELGRTVFEEDREAFLEAMKRKTLMKALAQNSTFIMTYRQTDARGAIYVSMKVSRMEDDETFLVVGISNVDSEMRDAMAKSAALAEALTSAKEANREKIAFLSNMSHEIRTPMNAIIGLDTLALKREGLDAETHQYLERIGDSARQLLNLINDIFTMSRIEAGRVLLHREVFSLHAMLEQISATAASRCADKELSYECRVLNEVGDAYVGDDMKLREVLLGILSNAVKFTEAPGSVTLTVERTVVFEDRSTLRFCVKDTGIGMDPEFLPRVFEPFAQENARLKALNGSTGLGMAIAKRLVEMMNGSIGVTSEKGAGSEFTVTVTLKNSDRAEELPDSTVDPGDFYVLVVDDDPVDAEHARSVLEEVGIRADACTSAQAALRMIETQHNRHEPYSLVLMDWNMPGMNGLEASDEIRRQYADESTVVVLTAYNWDDIQEEAHRVGVNSFLSKPLFAANVLEQFEEIARRNNMALLKEKKRADLTGRRVLLAEDVEINAEIMMDTLEMENVKADHAENGRIALELFEKSAPGTYAAILMDIRMPEMDGLEATAAIRALDREDARQIPIIAMTANAFEEDVQRSLQAGMNAHLNKPVESEQLFRILGELIYEAEKT